MLLYFNNTFLRLMRSKKQENTAFFFNNLIIFSHFQNKIFIIYVFNAYIYIYIARVLIYSLFWYDSLVFNSQEITTPRFETKSIVT